MKNDCLDAMILMSANVLAEKNSDELLKTDTSDTARPKYLDRKIKRIIRRERRKREYGSWYPVLKNTAAGILIACTVTLAMVMSVEAVRTALWETIMKWFDDYISIAHVTEDEVPTSIETRMQPTVYPNEWESEISGDTEAIYSVRYSCDGKLMVLYYQSLLNDENNWLDNDNIIIENIKVGESDGYLITYIDSANKSLIWSDGDYSFSLSTRYDDITVEILMRMAESVE